MKRKPWSPADIQFLRDNYPTKGAAYCADQLGRNKGTVQWSACRHGIASDSSRHRKPVRVPPPADFAEMHSSILSYDRLAKHYRVKPMRVYQWMSELGIERRVPKKETPPDNWAELCAEFCRAEIARHLGVTHHTVSSWADATGVSPKPYVRPVKEKAPKEPRQKATERPKGNPGWRPPHNIAHRLAGPRDAFERARDHLAKYFAVYRCRETGRADHEGECWRIGMAVISGDELLERAQRKGFVV